MVLEIECKKLAVLPNFLEAMGHNIATEGDIANTAWSLYFCIVSPSSLVLNQSPRLYFWLQKVR